jgi:DNA-binding PadR family transcriptional regulator
MYSDNSLIPSEAIRLLALGILAAGDRPYAQMAGEVRDFISHIYGPSLDLVMPPLELLKIEGLIDAAADGNLPGSEVLSLSEAGQNELHMLLTASVRAPPSDLNRLIIALKMRFLHLLGPAEQMLQAEILAKVSERELARLTELRAHHSGDRGHLTAWLDQEIVQGETRLAFFRLKPQFWGKPSIDELCHVRQQRHASKRKVLSHNGLTLTPGLHRSLRQTGKLLEAV